MSSDEPVRTRKQKIGHWTMRLVVPVVVVGVAVTFEPRPEAAGQYAGAVLELLGFTVLALGLLETLAQVTDQPGLLERVPDWFRKLMFWREPEDRTIFAEPLEAEVSVGEEAEAVVSPGPDASLEHRVEILEQEVEGNRKRIGKFRQDARKEWKELKGQIGDLRSELGEVEEEAEDLVRRQVIASLHWEATGLLWFAIGVVVATWPGVIPTP